MVAEVLIGLAVGLTVSWIFALAVVVIVDRRDTTNDLLRLLPLTLHLLGSLARDRNLPRSTRWRLAAAIVYAGQPFNLIPDWIPVIGYADNVAVIFWALRSVISKSGPQVVAAHWRGSRRSLHQLYKALRLDLPDQFTGGPTTETVSVG